MTYDPPIDTSDFATKAELGQKANASTVGGLSTAMNSKASQASVDALAASIPVPTDEIPMGDANTPIAGQDGRKVSGGKHRHPRPTSVTMGTIGNDGRATVMFTRTFTAAPGMDLIEIGGSTAAAAQPAQFKIESWIQETMSPAPAGAYTGCVVRAWRGQLLPALATVSGLLGLVITGVNAIVTALSGFNMFGATVAGTTFSCIAIQRTDV